MLFNSLEFLAFFAIVYTTYRLLPFRWQNRFLLAAGYVFYGWWDVRFLFLIAFSTTVDFSIGLMLGQGQVPPRQRLVASLFLVGCALTFLCVDWSALRAALTAPDTNWTRMVAADPLVWWVAAGTVAFALAANVLHDRVARMPGQHRQRVLLFSTVFVNLAFLGCFKYFNFFVDSAAAALHALGWDASLLHLHILLPVGISFYTFQSLSYTIDVARGKVVPTARLWDFALFVAYFPPMVAGPIERARNVLPQLLRPRRIRLDQSVDGVLLVLLGLFKKIAIADGLAPTVDSVFNSTGAVSSSDVALATVFFAFQIFCDFSGYSDIARGISKMLGIELMVNFDLPYLSKNPSEFWRRWHVSLSTWLRDYLYVPLGGNRGGRWRTYRNLMITMVLGGLWHGAAWNFVLWGFYQGALLCAHRLFTELLPEAGRPAPDPGAAPLGARTASLATGALRIGFFFLFVCYGWLLFRAGSLAQVSEFTAALLGLGPKVSSVIAKPPLSATLGLVLLALLQAAERIDGRALSFRRWPQPLQGLLYAVITFVLVMGMSNAPAQFIYFQF